MNNIPSIRPTNDHDCIGQLWDMMANLMGRINGDAPIPIRCASHSTRLETIEGQVKGFKGFFTKLALSLFIAGIIAGAGFAGVVWMHINHIPK